MPETISPPMSFHFKDHLSPSMLNPTFDLKARPYTITLSYQITHLMRISDMKYRGLPSELLPIRLRRQVAQVSEETEDTFP